jgi:hypothetical protein
VRDVKSYVELAASARDRSSRFPLPTAAKPQAGVARAEKEGQCVVQSVRLEDQLRPPSIGLGTRALSVRAARLSARTTIDV